MKRFETGTKLGAKFSLQGKPALNKCTEEGGNLTEKGPGRFTFIWLAFITFPTGFKIFFWDLARLNPPKLSHNHQFSHRPSARGCHENVITPVCQRASPPIRERNGKRSSGSDVRKGLIQNFTERECVNPYRHILDSPIRWWNNRDGRTWSGVWINQGRIIRS